MKAIYTTAIFICVLLGHQDSTCQNVAFSDASADFGLVFGTYDTAFGTGISFYDFDQDGLDDITITGSDGNNALIYRSIGDSLEELAFADHLADAFTTSILWVDYDNDNDMDMSATSDGREAIVLRNEGGLTFTDVSSELNLSTDDLISFGSAWADYDLDGDLDFYISNKAPDAVDNRNFFYENLGISGFEDITEQAMVVDSQGIGLGVVFSDFNKDGLPDIYIANDKFISHNTMYKNVGDGTFEDISQSSGTNIGIDAMGIAPGDFDNDGDEDLYITNTPQSSFDFGGNVFFLNQPNDTFVDIGGDQAMRIFRWGWGCNFADFNNDGHLDLFVANEGTTGSTLNNLFINNGDGTFIEELSTPISSAYGNSFGSAVGDINDDGWLDISTVNYGPSEVKLWLNEGGVNNWVKLILKGTLSNTEGVGSWIELYNNGEVQYRYKRCGVSYCSQDGRAVHFGLGQNQTVDSIKVIWPTQITETFYQLSSNVTHILEEASIVTYSNQRKQDFATLFPNPANDEIVCAWTNSFENSLSAYLHGANGKLIDSWNYTATNGHNKWKIPVSHIAQGVYTFSLVNGENRKMQKTVILR